MQKKRVLSLILALSCTAVLLGGCAGSDTSDDNAASGEHEVITTNAPYRNMSQFYDLVHEKYPEINLEIIPYNRENTSSHMKDMRLSGELPDIYSTTYYTPGRMDDEGDFLDLSGYDFMDNYTPSRLRDAFYNGGIYMLPMGYSAIGITYNKTLLDANGWTLPTNLDELATLKDEIEAAGYVFSRCQLEYPGFGFQFMCAIASISFLSNLEIAIGRVRSNAAPETDGSSVLSGMRFLCAEDNALNAEILEAILEMYGASCTICPDGAELVKAFEMVKPGEYDAILMDIQMPHMNGYEATKAIRGGRNPLGKTIPIIAMTASAFSDDIQNSIAAGMDAHISKPIDVAILEKTMRGFLAPPTNPQHADERL